MQKAVLIGGVGALGAAGVVAWMLLGQPEPAPAPEEPSAPALTAEDQRRAFLGDIVPVGFDTVQSGLSVRSGPSGGAVFELGEREITVSVPGGWELTGEFTLFTEVSVGFFLAREGAEADELPLYYYIDDARQRIEPASSAAGEQIYTGAAEHFRSTGEYPFLDSVMPVVRTEGDETGFYFCLESADGLVYQGGTRFIGPLAVTAMRLGACPETMDEIADRLWLAETALGANR